MRCTPTPNPTRPRGCCAPCSACTPRPARPGPAPPTLALRSMSVHLSSSRPVGASIAPPRLAPRSPENSSLLDWVRDSSSGTRPRSQSCTAVTSFCTRRAAGQGRGQGGGGGSGSWGGRRRASSGWWGAKRVVAQVAVSHRSETHPRRPTSTRKCMPHLPPRSRRSRSTGRGGGCARTRARTNLQRGLVRYGVVQQLLQAEEGRGGGRGRDHPGAVPRRPSAG